MGAEFVKDYLTERQFSLLCSLTFLRDSFAKLDVGYLHHKCCVICLSVMDASIEKYKEIVDTLECLPLKLMMPVLSYKLKDNAAMNDVAAQILRTIRLVCSGMGMLLCRQATTV
jgi:hypothetical protein